MKMLYQDLDIIKKRATELFTKNPRRSFSATFRSLRKKTYISFHGDYPILATIFHVIASLEIDASREKIIYAFNQSEELRIISKKEKTELLNQLINPSYDPTKSTKKLIKTKNNQKSNIVSS